MNTDEVRAAVLEMREGAYRVMTGQPAPPLEFPVQEAVVSEDTYQALTGQPRLGQPVRFNLRDILFRSIGDSHRSGRYPKVWKPRSYQPNRVVDGFIIGIRTLSNGDVTWGSYDEPTIYYPGEHFTAYLVAFDLRRKPVYLLPDDVEVRR